MKEPKKIVFPRYQFQHLFILEDKKFFFFWGWGGFLVKSKLKTSKKLGDECISNETRPSSQCTRISVKRSRGITVRLT